MCVFEAPQVNKRRLGHHLYDDEDASKGQVATEDKFISIYNNFVYVVESS